jgi:hypothetical protein
LWKTIVVINTNRFLLGLFLGTTLVVPLAISQPALAQTAAFKAQGRQAIVNAYTKIDQGTVANNPKIFEETLAPDFIAYADNGQTFNRTQVLARVYSSMGDAYPGMTVRFSKSKTKILSLKWRGSDAVIMAQSTQVATIRYQGRAVRLETVVVARDFWSRFKTGWLARQSVTTQASAWVDGKKIR